LSVKPWAKIILH